LNTSASWLDCASARARASMNDLTALEAVALTLATPNARTCVMMASRSSGREACEVSTSMAVNTALISSNDRPALSRRRKSAASAGDRSASVRMRCERSA